MPDPLLSEAIKEAYAAAPAEVIIHHTVELRHPAFSAPIRVVCDYEDLEATLEATAPEDAGLAVTFTAFAFRAKLPDVVKLPEFLLEIDNVSQEIEDNILLAAQGTDPITMTHRLYLSTDLTGPHNDPPATYTLRDVRANDFQVTARAGLPNWQNKRFPNQVYTVDRFPGLAR